MTYVELKGNGGWLSATTRRSRARSRPVPGCPGCPGHTGHTGAEFLTSFSLFLFFHGARRATPPPDSPFEPQRGFH